MNADRTGIAPQHIRAADARGRTQKARQPVAVLDLCHALGLLVATVAASVWMVTGALNTPPVPCTATNVCSSPAAVANGDEQ